MEWADVIEQIAGLAHLATVSPRGVPHVSIVSPAIEGETIWIGTTASSSKARNLVAMPKAALVWQTDSEVYVYADVDLVDDLDVKRRLWDGGVFAYDPAVFFDAVDNPDYVLLRLHPTSATVMSMTAAGPSQRRWRA